MDTWPPKKWELGGSQKSKEVKVFILNGEESQSPSPNMAPRILTAKIMISKKETGAFFFEESD